MLFVDTNIITPPSSGVINMPAVINAYASTSQGSTLSPHPYNPGPLAPNEIQVKVTHCGICHSDLAMIDNEWGNASYPIVPGHEVIGIVSELGSNVTRHKIGDRVGVGWQNASCMNCEWCDSGDHHLCSTQTATIVGHNGGFADYVRSHEYFAVPVPKALDSTNAAPLLCGGITVYNPFVAYDIKSTHRIGVIGIGGLGHLAIQFAAAWGCHVTAFSSTPNKESEARTLGAHDFIPSCDSAALQDARNSCDIIISAANANLDWSSYMQVLRPKGNLCIVGVPTSPITVTPFDLIIGQHSLTGSPIGSPYHIAQMFDFAAHHDIAAVTQEFPMNDLNNAISELRANRIRYRAVLVNES